MRVDFTIPGPPVGKERARRDPRSGRWFTPSKTRRYEGSVRALGVAALVSAGLYRAWPREGRYMLGARIYFPDARRRDADNVVKAVQDGLTGVLWDDDHRVGLYVTPPEVDRERPRVEVYVEVVK